MTRTLHHFKALSLAATAMAVACSVSAQSAPAPGTDGSVMVAQSGSSTTPTMTPAERRSHAAGEGSYSVIPYTSHGYLGLNLGKGDYGDVGCTAGFACGDKKTAVNIYTGGMFNRWLGVELGYVNPGRLDRAGGKTEAHGLNVSAVGRVPVGVVHLYGKLGAIYSRTEVSASPLAGIATGKETGWAPSVGAGIGFDLSPRSSIVLEWNRYDMRFVGIGKREVETTSIGYMHRF